METKQDKQRGKKASPSPPVSNKLMPDCEAGHESRGRCNERFLLVPSCWRGSLWDRMWAYPRYAETVQSTHTSRWTSRWCAASGTANGWWWDFGGRAPYLIRFSCANVVFQAAGSLFVASAGAFARLLIALDRPSAAGLLDVG